MPFDKSACDVKSKSETAIVVAGGALEAVEHAHLILFVNANAAIFDLQKQTAIFFVRKTDINATAVTILDGIEKKVSDHLIHASFIPLAHGRSITFEINIGAFGTRLIGDPLNDF